MLAPPQTEQSIKGLTSPLLSESPNVAFDTFFNPINFELNNTPKLPTPINDQTLESYQKRVKAWASQIKATFTQRVLPIQLSLLMRRPLRCRKITLDTKSTFIEHDQIAETHQIVIAGLNFDLDSLFRDEIRPKLFLPISEWIKMKQPWCSRLIPLFPDPQLYQSQADFLSAVDKWKEIALRNLDESDIPFHPDFFHSSLNFDYSTQYEVIERKIPNKRDNTMMPSKFIPFNSIHNADFSRTDIVKHFLKDVMKEMPIQQKKLKPPPHIEELIEFGCDFHVYHFIDLNYSLVSYINTSKNNLNENDRVWVKNNLTDPSLKDNAYSSYLKISYLLYLDPNKLTNSQRSFVVLYFVNTMSRQKASHLIPLFNDIWLFYRFLLICLSASKKKHILVKPANLTGFILTSNQSIIHLHRIFVTYHFYQCLFDFLKNNGHEESAEAISSYVTSATEQVLIYLPQFESNFFHIVRSSLCECSAELIYVIFRIIFISDFMGMYMSNNFQHGVLLLLNDIALVSEKYFRILYVDSLLNPFTTFLYFKIVINPNFKLDNSVSEKIASIIQNAMKIRPDCEYIKKYFKAEIDCGWVYPRITEIIKLMMKNPKRSKRLIYPWACVVCEILLFVKRVLKLRIISVKTWVKNFYQIISLVVETVLTIGCNKNSTAKLIEGFAAQLTCKPSMEYFTKELNFQYLLSFGISSNKNVSDSIWHVIRKVFLKYTKHIPILLTNELWRTPMIEVLSKINILQTPAVFLTLSKLIKFLVPNDQKSTDEKYQSGLIFSLSSVPQEVLSFLQIMSEAGFKPLKVAAAFLKLNGYEKDKMIVKDFLEILQYRESCCKIILKTGKKGKELTTMPKRRKKSI